jgi:hypothetical protein
LVYDSEVIKEARLRRLVESGDIIWEEGKWKLANTRLIPIANLVFGLKKLVLRKESEFDKSI